MVCPDRGAIRHPLQLPRLNNLTRLTSLIEVTPSIRVEGVTFLKEILNLRMISICSASGSEEADNVEPHLVCLWCLRTQLNVKEIENQYRPNKQTKYLRYPCH
jgi:hypothetical protein